MPEVTEADFLAPAEEDEGPLFFIAFFVALEPEFRSDGEDLLALLTLRGRREGLSWDSYDPGE